MDKANERILFLYALSILVGALTGFLGSYFQIAIARLDETLQHLMKATHWTGAAFVLLSAVVSMIMVSLAWMMVKYISPEASGSGVQEIEGTLLHKRPIHWRRLLPVKFFAGILAIASHLVVGREGPTIQIGGNLGDMVGEGFKVARHRRDALISAGAAAGLATAFNAPLAGVLFVIEEMRNAFNFSFTHFKMVIIACVSATLALHSILGDKPAIVMPVFATPDLEALWLFFLFGILVGMVGLYFNKLLMISLGLMDKWGNKFKTFYVPCIGLIVGALFILEPRLVGGGYTIIHESLTMSLPLNLLCWVFFARFILTMCCYSTSVPGGIFAPMLALGTILGMIFDQSIAYYYGNATVFPGMFAVAGMGALFAAAVRAPITGIILVVEMTQNYNLIFPLMITCLTSTTVVQLAKNAPIYVQLLQRTLKMGKNHTS